MSALKCAPRNGICASISPEFVMVQIWIKFVFAVGRMGQREKVSLCISLSLPVPLLLSL